MVKVRRLSLRTETLTHKQETKNNKSFVWESLVPFDHNDLLIGGSHVSISSCYLFFFLAIFIFKLFMITMVLQNLCSWLFLISY